MSSQGRYANYKIQCVNDGKVFNNIYEVCDYYKMTKDQVAYRLDVVKEYHDGMNFIRIPNEEDDKEAMESIKSVNCQQYIDKFGDKTVPIPGYEGIYTISTNGLITNVKSKPRRYVKVKSKVTVKNTVILHNGDRNYTTQVHSVEGLLKKAFGDVEENNEDTKEN